MKRITQRMPDGHVRTHYMRLAGLGDGTPVTSPDQDPTTGEIQMPDDYVGSGPAPSTTDTSFDSSSNQVVATVGPIITGVTGAVTSTVDWLKNALSSTPTVSTPPSTTSGAAAAVPAPQPNMLVLAAVALGGYAAYKHFSKKKRVTAR